MRYASFMVRLWQPEMGTTSPDSALHGRIEHVQSGTVVTVTRLEDVTMFIREHLLGAGQDVDEEEGNDGDQF